MNIKTGGNVRNMLKLSRPVLMNTTNRRRPNFFGGIKWISRDYLNIVNFFSTFVCTKSKERYPGSPLLKVKKS